MELFAKQGEKPQKSIRISGFANDALQKKPVPGARRPVLQQTGAAMPPYLPVSPLSQKLCQNIPKITSTALLPQISCYFLAFS
ncbi:hypothetical protein [Butyricicoccus porcorum]|uniref:Uncharacterized protein n=1 Tax=Butyricicoccus porcorum TaxID=1945634 RepID=A0A252F3K3_9FIRM|nr:hypothetical protein [Butyricicoccus porcorum]MCI6925648.1 hypothetical protein [Butyricicoccus porcorum]MDD6986549.1 hypothetical protein [Butyricicoccus porcorum]MDY4482530.1 hypothetical protein [Butyricicoccus porcorum]OUM20367.1 hypothetical protein CBW42_05880 [Butyricicoccus porcorum]